MCGLFTKAPEKYLVMTDERLTAVYSDTAKSMGLKPVAAKDIETCPMRSTVFLAVTLDSFADVKEKIADEYRNRFAIRYIMFWPRYKFSSDMMQNLIERMDDFLISTPGIVAPFMVSNEICNWDTALRFSDSLNTSTCEIGAIPDYGDVFIVFYEEEHIE